MTSLDLFVRDGHLIQSATAPYAQPLSGRFAESSARDGGKPVGPYVPAAVRVRPPLASKTPLYVPPTVLAMNALVEEAAPPAPPVPAYFASPYSAPILDDPDERAAETTLVRSEVVPLNAPEPLRADTSALPWIDNYLANTPALPMPSIGEPVVPLGASDASLAGSMEPDDWALSDSVHQLRHLARELTAQDQSAHDGPARLHPMATHLVLDGLARWGDDDFVRVEAETARATPLDGAEAAARALEVLAGRVRDGEISLTGYGPQLGDAAVLATALAALLGVRR